VVVRERGIERSDVKDRDASTLHDIYEQEDKNNVINPK